MVQNMQFSDQSTMATAAKANLNAVMAKSGHPIACLVSGKR
jgi:hypothetical protein